jgi:hypothetical protein
MKEVLVSTALQLQVSQKASADDELTINYLRKLATESKISEISAKKHALEASEVIESLKVEIASLKRQLKEPSKQTNTNSQSSLYLNAINDYGEEETAPNNFSPAMSKFSNIFIDADVEVERMIATPKKNIFRPSTGGNPHRTTPFQQWKINKFIFSSDAPAGSIEHEKDTVDLLAEISTRESLNQLNPRPGFAKLSKSSIGKMKLNSLKSLSVKVNTTPISDIINQHRKSSIRA